MGMHAELKVNVLAILLTLALILTKARGQVEYNQRSFIIDGKPTLLLSGSIHYPRVPPSDWENVILSAKALGLNCIQTCVFWSEHEQERRLWNWEGYADLPRFLALLSKHEMYAVVRIGPYVCAEFHFGGLPLWMRDSGAECFRCYDAVWRKEMEQFTSTVVDKIGMYIHSEARPHGPIIAFQIENEYFKPDPYLEWAVDMARNITNEVPWFICHAVEVCVKLNNIQTLGNDSDRGHDKVLCSINGFWMDDSKDAMQPSPKFFETLWNSTTNQPAMWTEDQGWFDLWEWGHRVREDQLYGISRFLAHGGSFHNFYMFTGGNSYNYRSGRSSTTAYAPDTVVDSFLLRHEPRFSHYQEFFATMHLHIEELLSHPAARTVYLNNITEAHEYGVLAFLSNIDETKSTTVMYRDTRFFLPSRSVIILNEQLVVFNTSCISHARPQQRTADVLDLSAWKAFPEKVGQGTMPGVRGVNEQLSTTDNQSDYMYYTFYHVGKILNMSIETYGSGTICYVYLNGNYSERISSMDYVSVADEFALDDVQTISRRYLSSSRVGKSFTVRVDILSVAMGLDNFGVSPSSGKGVQSVNANGKQFADFETSWMLLGEELAIHNITGSKRVSWMPARSFANSSLVWFQTSFVLPLHFSTGGSQPDQTALVADLTGLNKGILYVNGFLLGRYWLAVGECTNGDCAPPIHGKHCYIRWKHCGEPTQALYHIPFELLNDDNNLLTVFEETIPNGVRILENVQVKLIYDHPY